VQKGYFVLHCTMALLSREDFSGMMSYAIAQSTSSRISEIDRHHRAKWTGER
jgi:hypothetical protein